MIRSRGLRSSSQTSARCRSSCHEEQVQRVDLGDRGCRPHRAHCAQHECRSARDGRTGAQPEQDRGGDPEGARHQDRRQQVGPERDRADGHQVRQPPKDDVRRVARRMGDTQDVRNGLHLSPVAEGEAGQQGPEVHGERDEAHDRGQYERGARKRPPGPGRRLAHRAPVTTNRRNQVIALSSAESFSVAWWRDRIGLTWASMSHV